MLNVPNVPHLCGQNRKEVGHMVLILIGGPSMRTGCSHARRSQLASFKHLGRLHGVRYTEPFWVQAEHIGMVKQTTVKSDFPRDDVHGLHMSSLDKSSDRALGLT